MGEIRKALVKRSVRVLERLVALEKLVVLERLGR
jgi:hypothetical protein